MTEQMEDDKIRSVNRFKRNETSRSDLKNMSHLPPALKT